MQWSQQQSHALNVVKKWFNDKKSNQVFRLFGYAGTGKTTLATHFAAGISGTVLFACFTGKAALVLRKKGCENARTLHSLIYKINDNSSEKLEFVINNDSEIKKASLLIVDEVSMVDEEIGLDLLSFGVKILVLGDPEQLPPIRGEGFFTSQKPDWMLEEIHRQAKENPIIKLSMDVRSGERIKPGLYGDSKVILRKDVQRNEVLDADQVLVGMNKTRQSYNERMRELIGYQNAMPEINDKLVCLKNNRDKCLLNGSLWTVSTAKYSQGLVEMDVVSLDGLPDPGKILVPNEFFIGKESILDWKVRRMVDEFCFSYALTVHKSQGSQWDNVMLFDESASFRENRIKHLYTGITRAAERITIVI